MSVYVKRYYEVYDNYKWIPIKSDGKLLFNIDNLSNCRSELSEYSSRNLPEDISSEIRHELENNKSLYDYGYCTLHDLYEFLDKEENNFINVLASNSGYNIDDPNHMSDRDILISIYKTINCNPKDIYIDYSYSIYGFSFLIGEVTSMASLYDRLIIPNNIRLIFAFE